MNSYLYKKFCTVLIINCIQKVTTSCSSFTHQVTDVNINNNIIISNSLEIFADNSPELLPTDLLDNPESVSVSEIYKINN